MSYYEELGIPPTAAAADIKRAYRKRATETHPDKGGSDEAFARVAKAYDVLKDPQRRQLYDSTGKDSRQPIDIAVQDRLLSVFSQVLSAPGEIEIVATVRKSFEEGLLDIVVHKKKAIADRKKLQAKRGKVKTTNAVNVVHLIIDQKLRGIDAALADMKYEAEIGRACLKALKTYSEEYEPPPSMTIREQVYGIYFRDPAASP